MYPHPLEPGEILDYERHSAGRDIAAVPGTVLEDVLIPARGFLRARLLPAGRAIRIAEVEGQQVADIMLYDASNLRNCSSMSNSILIAKTTRLTVGDSIYAKFGEKLATIVADTVGDIVTSGGFCNPEVNELRYGVEGTHTCRMNFVASMARFNLTPADIEEGCFSIFMNLAQQADGSSEIQAPRSRPGDYFDIRAESSIIVAVSNCPSERNPCNAWNPTPLRAVVYEPESRPHLKEGTHGGLVAPATQG